MKPVMFRLDFIDDPASDNRMERKSAYYRFQIGKRFTFQSKMDTSIILLCFKRAFNVVGIEFPLRLQSIFFQIIRKFPIYTNILFFNVEQRDIRYQFFSCSVYIAGYFIVITGNIENIIYKNKRQDIIFKMYAFKFDRLKKSKKIFDIVKCSVDIFKRGLGFTFRNDDILCFKYEFFIEFDV